MTNVDRRYLRATTKTLERLISVLVSVADEAIDTYGDSPAYQPLRNLHVALTTIRSSRDFDDLRRAGRPE